MTNLNFLYHNWLGDQKGGEIYYCEYDSISGWSEPENISQSSAQSEFPFIEAYGDKLYAVWDEDVGRGNFDVIKKNKRINEYWPYAQDTIPSSGDSRYPVNTEGEFTVWSEQTTAADGGWEIYCQRNDEDPINISNTPNVNSRFSHASRRLTLGNDYLYTAWTEGNAAPYRVLIEKTRFPVEHETLIAFSSVNVGQVQPSIYTVERTGYIQSWGHPVDYGDSILIYHFPHLNPEMIYEVEPEFYHEGGGIWIAKVYVNGNYMGLISYSPGILQKERFLLPPDIYQEGEMTVRLEKVAGDMVTVAGFNVYRFEQGGDVGGGPMSSGAGEGNNLKPTMRLNQRSPEVK